MQNKNISIFVIFLTCTLSLLSSAAVKFVDVTAASGIDFRHINGAEGAYHLRKPSVLVARFLTRTTTAILMSISSTAGIGTRPLQRNSHPVRSIKTTATVHLRTLR